jgi:hexosaminidase
MFKLFVLFGSILACCYAAQNPPVKPSKGGVWPKPQYQETSENYLVLLSRTFSFKGPANIGCPDFLNDAFARYWTIIATSSSLEQRGQLSEVERQPQQKFWEADDNFVGYLDSLNVELIGECVNEAVLPELGDNENYTLTISSEESTLSAPTIWGVLRGLETFSQLVHVERESLVVNATIITDFPKFPHRGLLLDTSRHFQPVYIILQNLDAMAYNKLNVLHWHIVDDPSFPYVSHTYPELSEKGAYHPVSKVYEQSDVRKIIEYARVRGIRVIPEFDTPGHGGFTSSWGLSHPELLTPCYSNDQPNGQLGPMDPTKNSTYTFLTNFYKEVIDVFPDSYIHVGGDTIDFSCWKSNPDVNAFMSANDISSYEQLDAYFFENTVSILDSLSSKYLVQQEAFLYGATLPKSTVVQVMKLGLDVLAALTKADMFGIYSGCWLLDKLSGGGDWEKFYNCEPLDFDGTDEQKKRVLGGEALMWGEIVNEYIIMPRVWPRASAVAEKLWSAQDVNDIEAAKPRLQEQACRMNRRGIAAQPPNGSGVCL